MYLFFILKVLYNIFNKYKIFKWKNTKSRAWERQIQGDF